MTMLLKTLCAALTALTLAAMPALALSSAEDPFFIWYTFAELDLDTGEMSDDLKGLDGKEVEVPGFVVPTEFNEEGVVTEFILVPSFGYCIHVPPPPPNQMVYVKMKKPFTVTDIWLPMVVTGKLSLSPVESEFGEVSYLLEGDEVRVYKGEGGSML
ncbi:MAG: DUF3299 domain-containing protein [Alphaproteobacteria bacterium]|nr:DUF3299 domain-containing protein [Alphaproteobacteria bacterium]